MVIKTAEKRFVDSSNPAAASTFDLYATPKQPAEKPTAPGSGAAAIRPSGWRG